MDNNSGDNESIVPNIDGSIGDFADSILNTEAPQTPPVMSPMPTQTPPIDNSPIASITNATVPDPAPAANSPVLSPNDSATTRNTFATSASSANTQKIAKPKNKKIILICAIVASIAIVAGIVILIINILSASKGANVSFGEFNDSYFFIAEKSDSKTSYAFFDNQGNRISDFSYAYGSDFVMGYAVVRNDAGDYALINARNEVVIDYGTYASMTMYNGLIDVTDNNDDHKLIDLNQKTIVSWDNLLDISRFIYTPGSMFLIFANSENQYTIYNYKGEVVDTFIASVKPTMFIDVTEQYVFMHYNGSLHVYDNQSLEERSKTETNSIYNTYVFSSDDNNLIILDAAGENDSNIFGGYIVSSGEFIEYGSSCQTVDKKLHDSVHKSYIYCDNDVISPVNGKVSTWGGNDFKYQYVEKDGLSGSENWYYSILQFDDTYALTISGKNKKQASTSSGKNIDFYQEYSNISFYENGVVIKRLQTEEAEQPFTYPYTLYSIKDHIYGGYIVKSMTYKECLKTSYYTCLESDDEIKYDIYNSKGEVVIADIDPEQYLSSSGYIYEVLEDSVIRYDKKEKKTVIIDKNGDVISEEYSTIFSDLDGGLVGIDAKSGDCTDEASGNKKCISSIDFIDMKNNKTIKSFDNTNSINRSNNAVQAPGDFMEFVGDFTTKNIFEPSNYNGEIRYIQNILSIDNSQKSYAILSDNSIIKFTSYEEHAEGYIKFETESGNIYCNKDGKIIYSQQK